ncbi:unnamed protein product [Xylocopa violacea]|uniref:Uncharacterized protein n=1 Tax=Xylocopa violacea TaxID=135666 RepID=A0ABP1NDC4_XYLVO
MRLQAYCIYLCFLLLVALTSLSQARSMEHLKGMELGSIEERHHVQRHHVEVRSPQLKPVGDLVENVLTDTGKAVGELVGGKDNKDSTKAPN